MIFKGRNILLFSILFAGTTCLHGQAIFDTLYLNEFEIIGYQDQGGSTVKVQQIDSLQMHEFGQQDLGEMIAAFTPAYVKSYGKGTLSTVSFRGAGSAHTQVLWEGFQINSPMLGQVDFSQVPNAFFTNVELLFGGSTLSNTSGAFGGSVNLSSSTKGGDAASKLKLEQTMGSFNTWLTSVEIPIKMGNLLSTTKMIRNSSDNDFTYYNNGILPSQEMKQKNASFSHVGLMQQFELPVGENQKWYVITWNQWFDRDLPAIMTNVYKLQQEYQSDFTSRTILGWKKNSRAASYEVKGAYFHEYFHYYLQTFSQDSSHQTVVLNDTKNRINSFSLKGNAVLDLGHGFIMNTGIDLGHQTVYSPNYESEKVRKASLIMASIEKTLLEKLTLKLLLREEYSDDSFLPLLPYFGINYSPFAKKSIAIRWNMSKNYKRPTLNELYFYPMGNENLLPESAFETEAGLDINLDFKNEQQIFIGFSWFYSSIHNWIQWLPGDFDYWTPFNVDQVISKGLESSIKWESKWQKIKMTASGQYTYTQTNEYQDELGVQMPYIPVHQANGFVSLDYSQYFIRWNVGYVGERTTTLDSEHNFSKRLPDYWLHHLAIGKGFILKKLHSEARIKVYNIFDVNYQAVKWRAMPGRYAEFSIKLYF